MGMRRSQVEGSGLVLVLALAGIGLGVIDLGLASKPNRLITHVHHPNFANIYVPSWTDPFTCTSCSSTNPSILPGLVGRIKQFNGTNNVWVLILVEITFKISPAGTAFAYIYTDGLTSGVSTETTSTNYITQSLFVMTNNTFTDNLFHIIDVRVASSNVLDTVSVRGVSADALGNAETYMSIADLSSFSPT